MTFGDAGMVPPSLLCPLFECWLLPGQCLMLSIDRSQTLRDLHRASGSGGTMLRVAIEPHVTSSWRSLLRTTRAPVSMLVIAAMSLALPSQTADELAALHEMYVGPVSGLLILQLSL